MEGNNLLQMELTVLNTFTNHHFQLYLGWYTFFLTINCVAIGWFTSELPAGTLKKLGQASQHNCPSPAHGSSMKTFLMAVILIVGTGGCTGLTGPGSPMYRSGQERKLSQAVTLLEQGKTEAAMAALDAICADPALPGVSDEALFRVSLLHLGKSQGAGGTAQTQNELERLMKEYPASSWTPMASNLSKFIGDAAFTLQLINKVTAQNDSLADENKKLKESNLSMTRQIKEIKGSSLSAVQEHSKLNQENAKLKGLIQSLTQENAELRDRIEKIKTLDLELEGTTIR